MTTRLSFVRHGEVQNPKRIFYGRLPGFGLSEAGRRQAYAAAESLRKAPLRALYTSELLRARETADIIQSAHAELVPIPSPLLLEVYSPYEGTPYRVMEGRGWDLYNSMPAGYEQPADVLARVHQFIARMRVRHSGEHIVAVTHGDPIAFLILWAHGRRVGPQSQAALYEIGIPGGYPQPASITTLTYCKGEDAEVPAVEHVVPYAL